MGSIVTRERLRLAVILGVALAALLGPAASHAAPVVVATVPTGSTPTGVAVNPVTNRAYVANQGSNSLSVIDTTTDSVVAVLGLGGQVAYVAVNATTNRVYVTQPSLNRVAVINGATNTLITNILVGTSPRGVAVNPTTNRVYVANNDSNSLAVINGSTNTVLAIVSAPGGTQGVAVNPGTDRVYVTGFTANLLAMYDGNGSFITSTLLGTPHGVGVHTGLNRVYVALQSGGVVAVRDGATLAAQGTVTVGSLPRGVAVDSGANRVYVAASGSNALYSFNATLSGVQATAVGSSPIGVAVNPSTNRVYVTNQSSASLSVLYDDLIRPETTITGTPPNPSPGTATFSFTGTDNFTPAGSLTFECFLDSGAFTPCLSPKTYTGLSTGSHTFAVRAIDGAGNTDLSVAVHSWTVDATAPDSTITASPSDPSPGNVSFGFAGTDNLTPPGSLTFECRIDGGAFGACASPATYDLPTGSHTFEVRATDGVGNVDATPASFTWNVDATPPNTIIVDGPAPGSVQGTSATFEFIGTDNLTPSGSLDFECRLDGGTYAACTSPHTLTGLGGGSHTLEVRAVDGVGNADPTPAGRTWLVEANPPDTSITSSPPDPTNQTAATFSFAGTDDVSQPNALTFECDLDGAGFSACTSPRAYAGLAPGSHTFQVRSTDEVGNVDPTPASYTWTIDLTPPDTTIGSGPPSPTNDTSATFTFGGSDDLGGPVAFECRLDGGAYAGCASPHTLTGITPGTHTFEVRAVDQATNADPTPASFTWGVDGGPPVSSFTTPDGAVLFNIGAFVTPVTGSTTDDMAGVDEVTVTFTPLTPGGTAQSGPALLTCDASGLACTWAAFPPGALGQYEVSVSGADNLGNVEGPGPSITVVVVAPPAL